MPLIQFPDVPFATGVPNVERAAIGIATQIGLATIQKYDTFGLLSKFLGQVWAIVDENGFPVIQPDSVVGLEYKNEQKIATFPIENGSFQSYNKVAMPFDIRMRMTCNGQGIMTRDSFLAQMQTMLESINLYSVVTPDVTYTNVNLEHYDYRRESHNGVQLLTVDAWFTEIRQPANAYNAPTVQPSGAKKYSLGNVNLSIPSVPQLASYASSVIF